MQNSSRWSVDELFVAGTGAVMAIVFAFAPFIGVRPVSGEHIQRFSVLQQAREFEQICQTITPEEAKALKSSRRC